VSLWRCVGVGCVERDVEEMVEALVRVRMAAGVGGDRWRRDIVPHTAVQHIYSPGLAVGSFAR